MGGVHYDNNQHNLSVDLFHNHARNAVTALAQWQRKSGGAVLWRGQMPQHFDTKTGLWQVGGPPSRAEEAATQHNRHRNSCQPAAEESHTCGRPGMEPCLEYLPRKRYRWQETFMRRL